MGGWVGLASWSLRVSATYFQRRSDSLRLRLRQPDAASAGFFLEEFELAANLARDRIEADGHRLMLLSASIAAMGAGMEPPSEARFESGRWIWEPKRALEELRLTRSPYARDYTICWEQRCSTLSALTGASDEGVITVRAC